MNSVFGRFVRAISSLSGLIVGVYGLSFYFIAAYLGGTSFFGKVVDGRFYLGEDQIYVQVPEWVYRYSQIHGWSLVIFVGIFAIVLATDESAKSGNK